ncbi:queuosine precursor transporter [Candidatus Woesearchaeota archaeon]|nr:queuosine precursor transporter [Candidatus Woesearchaeota archaeon]
MKWDVEFKTNLLLGFYVAALIASNLLGGKLMPIGFGNRGLTVSIIMFPFLFLITDIVGEVQGKKKARQFVNIGLISLLVVLLWQLFSLSVPAAVPNEWYNTFNESYKTVFSLSLTFTIASILAFFFGQYVDVATYHIFRKKHKGKYIWLRNNISTIFGQFVDSSIWTLIAFSPKLFDGTFTLFSIYSIIIVPYWLAKVVVAFLDTPLAYLGIWWLRSKDKKG